MNWRTAALNSLCWKVLLLGGAAGVWGAFLYECALLVQSVRNPAAIMALLPGAALGFGLGTFLSPIDEIVHRYSYRTLQSAMLGAVLGTLLGAGGLSFILWIAEQPYGRMEGGDGLAAIFRTWAWPPILLGLIGASIGVGSALAHANRARIVRRSITGLVVGFALGIPIAPLMQQFMNSAWVVMASISLWGALLAVALYWWEKRVARRWLRLLTGPGEDAIFPLDGMRITMGKSERNDIPLLNYQEIYPFHCTLRWRGDHYEIVDNEQGGMVLVNYRQVQEQALKRGDLIKVGSALLQYGEAS